MLKRLFDILFAAAVLTAGALPIALLCALVRWRMGAPVFFVQERTGRGGRVFRMVKFRTMSDRRDAAGNLLPDAERLTPLGAFLRRTSLDELPEFWNVLRGDMSVVGPRPLLPRYMALYTPEQARRHEVRPGVTGWTAINGRNAISWEEKFRCDLWYIEHRGFWLDMRIIAVTALRALLPSRDATTAEGATMPEFRGAAGGGR